MLIIISNDCDLIHNNFKSEPFAEVLVAKPIDKKQTDGRLTLGKNPRKFQFDLAGPKGSLLFEISVHSRRTIQRRHLTKDPPDAAHIISPKIVRALALWMAKRYNRAVFPTAFNERIKDAASAIEKELRRGGEHISGIYLTVRDDELKPGDPYEIIIWATMKKETHQIPELRKKCQGAIDVMAAKLSECKDIEVMEHSLVSEKDVTLDDLHYLKRWDYDTLSLREEPPSPMAPEG